jgi:ABC-type branched-subunit amino acid transport system substrate-binding protein
MIAFLSFFSCSLNISPQKSCETTMDCKTNWGFGHYCVNTGDDKGFCSEIKPSQRCFLSFPTEMYSLEMEEAFDQTIEIDWNRYSNHKIVGVLFDHNVNQRRIAAANLAAKTVNENFGEDFVLVHCDYQDDEYNEYDGLKDEDAVKEVTSYLAEELNVPVIIGPSGSADVEASYQITSQTDTILISPSATSPSLTGLNGIWRPVGSDDVQGRILAHLILQNIADADLNLENEIHIVYENSSYGQNFYITMKDVFDQADSPPNISTHSYEEMNDDFLSEFRNSGAGGNSIVMIDADVVDIGFFMDEVLADADFENSVYYLTDAASKTDLFTAITGKTDEYYQTVYGTRPQTSRSAEYENFASNYKNFSNFEADEDSFVPYTYDAAWLGFVTYASATVSLSKKSYEITGSDLEEKMYDMSDTAIEPEKAMDIEWFLIQGPLSQGNTVNVKGVTGSLDFDPTTGEVITDVEIWRIKSDDTSTTPCDILQGSCPSSNLDNLDDCEYAFEQSEYENQICE